MQTMTTHSCNNNTNNLRKKIYFDSTPHKSRHVGQPTELSQTTLSLTIDIMFGGEVRPILLLAQEFFCCLQTVLLVSSDRAWKHKAELADESFLKNGWQTWRRKFLLQQLPDVPYWKQHKSIFRDPIFIYKGCMRILRIIFTRLVNVETWTTAKF